mgnify:CR=1 FL=1
MPVPYLQLKLNFKTAELKLQMSFTVLLATYIGGIGFFLGACFGAILFTILQTVKGLQKEFKCHKAA